MRSCTSPSSVRRMSCEGLPAIVCRLERIATELERFDVEGVIASFAATLVGALSAAVVAWLVFRGESQERYQERLTDAVESLSTAMTRTAREFADWQEKLSDYYEIDEDVRGFLAVPDPPDRVLLDVSLDMLIARARGADRKTAQQIREVAYQLSYVRDGAWARAEYATLRRVVVAWRAGRKSQREIRADLATIDERRRLAGKQKRVDDTELPPAPEKYEPTPLG